MRDPKDPILVLSAFAANLWQIHREWGRRADGIIHQILRELTKSPPNIEAAVKVIKREADENTLWSSGFRVAANLQEAISWAVNVSYTADVLRIREDSEHEWPVSTRPTAEPEIATRGWPTDEEEDPFAVRSDMDKPLDDREDWGAPEAPPLRFLNAQTQERADIGNVFSLYVQIAVDRIKAGFGSGSTGLGIGAAELTISLRAPAFDFLGDSEQRLAVPATGNSDELRFSLKARREGVQIIKVTAWNRSVQVGTVEVQVAIGTAQPVETVAKSPMEMREPEGGEYTLEIEYDPRSSVYSFQLRGDDIGVMKPQPGAPLLGDARTDFQNLLDSLNAQARNLNRLTEDLQKRWLKGLGRIMVATLMPPVVHDQLWNLRGKIRRLNIFSVGNPMPWELMYLDPLDGVGQGFFLADVAGVARWRYGPPPPNRIHCVSPYLVQPAGPPAQTEAEIASMKKIYPGARVLTQMEELLDVLESGGFGLMHFASHNVAQTEFAGGSYIPFGAGKFDLTFMGNVLPNRYQESRPLVFMNACASAGQAPLFTEMSSWSDRYVASGAGAFIGSLWEVRDRTALSFAEAFHSEIKAGKSLGEAMSVARDTLQPGDPTRLAYVLYGNSTATIEID